MKGYEGDEDPVDFSPAQCELSYFEDDARQEVISSFNSECSGKSQCEFLFKQSSLPAEKCMNKPPRITKPSAMKFLMTADCISDSVTIWGVEYEMSKGNVATIVVLIDLIISFAVWFALISLKQF